MRLFKVRSIQLLGTLIGVFFFTTTALAVDYYDQILAKVNGEIITKFDLDQRMKPYMANLPKGPLSPELQIKLNELQREILDRMIRDQILDEEIQRFGLYVEDEAVDEEIERMKAERGMDDEAFRKDLADDKMSIDEFREKVRKAMQQRRLLAHFVHNKTMVTESEVQTEYEKRISEFTKDSNVELAIIVFREGTSAAEVHDAIKTENLTFDVAAARHSVGPAAGEGGGIGKIDMAMLADDWKKALEGVEAGNITPPIVLENGAEAILKLISRSEGDVLPLEEVRAELEEKMLEERREQLFNEYMEGLMEKAVIEYSQ